MKSKTSMLLNKKWWENEQPKGIEGKSGKAFLKAIETFEKANAALQKEVDAKKLIQTFGTAKSFYQ